MLQHLQTIHFRHFYVQQDGIEFILHEQFQCNHTRFGFTDIIFFVFQDFPQGAPDTPFIIYDENL